MILSDESRLFTKFTGDSAGLPIYILNELVAPAQQSFYFVNDCMSADSRYMWLYGIFPPSSRKVLAVVDAVEGNIRVFPETQFDAASPYIDSQTGELYWAGMGSIWKRGPGKNDEAQYINSIPDEIIRGRPVTHLACHLTRSANGKEFFVDAKIGLQYIFGTLPVDGGDYQLWHQFNRCYNHAQFSPVDPDRILFCQEFHTDPLTGIVTPFTDRMWTMRRGQSPAPVMPEPTFAAHEYWDCDGEHIWCIDCSRAVWRVNIDTGEKEIVWDNLRGALHSHTHASGRYVIADYSLESPFYRGARTGVSFFNRDTGREIRLVDNPAQKNFIGANYHIDPHPRFCADGSYVIFTTTVRNKVELAVVFTNDMIDRTS